MAKCWSVLLALFGLLAQANGVRADDPASREIVMKAIEAHGGAAKLSKYKASTTQVKGTTFVGGNNISFTGNIVAQGEDQHSLTININVDGNDIRFVHVLNHDKAWLKLNGVGVDQGPEEVADAREEAHSNYVVSLLPLQDKAYSLTPFGEADVEGRPAVGINVERKDRRTVTLFFDKETHRVVKLVARIKDETTRQELTQESIYKDYREVEGTQQPSKIAVYRDGNHHADIEVTEVKLSEGYDDSYFGEPQ